MGIGNSTLHGGSSRARGDAWSQTTSASEQQRARPADQFEGVDAGQEQPVPPVTVAQVHAFAEQRAAQWRGPDPAGVPARWPATAFQLWANLTQTAQPRLTGPGSNGTTALSANEAANLRSLDDLPPELLSMIAEHLPGEDVGRLRQANHRLHAAFIQEAQAIRLVRQAQHATLLTEFQALLGEPDEGMAVIRGLRMSLQERPLVTLISRIRVLPDSGRLTAFKRIRDAVTAARFPMERRAASLAELAQQIEYLHAGDRLTAFNLIHAAVTAATFPMACRALPLAELARQIRDLHSGDRSTAFNLIHDAVTAVAFPLARRAVALARLAWRIPDLSAPDRQSAYGRILSAVTGLARQNRGAVLEALASAIIHLPQQTRRSALDATLAAIAELDLPDSGAPLDALALSLSFLLTSDPSEALRRFVAEIEWLPERRRAQMLGAIR